MSTIGFQELGSVLNVDFGQVDSPAGLEGHTFYEQDTIMSVDFGQVETSTRVENDYEQLINKPQIEGVTLEGNIHLPDLNAATLLYHTEAEWDAQSALITGEGVIYVYSDHTTVVDPDTGDVTVVPALKIGDGVSYLSELPFIGGGASPEIEQELEALTQTVNDHIANSNIHVSTADRTEWNRKVSARIDEHNPEMLIIY